MFRFFKIRLNFRKMFFEIPNFVHVFKFCSRFKNSSEFQFFVNRIEEKCSPYIEKMFSVYKKMFIMYRNFVQHAFKRSSSYLKKVLCVFEYCSPYIEKMFSVYKKCSSCREILFSMYSKKVQRILKKCSVFL